MFPDSKLLVLFLTRFFISNAQTAPVVQFYFSTAENNEPFQSILPENQLFDRYEFNEYTKIFFIIHGWLQSSHEPYIREVIRLKSQEVDLNGVFITVDWSKYAKLEYDDAQAFNSIVAAATSSLISLILLSNNVSPANIEVIGHCMGCHIAGMACRKVFLIHGEKIAKITALDPSGPGYYGSDNSEKLSADDAEVVFVVHTDAYMFGYGDKCGTIDFYPNGGRYPQPGCLNVSGIIEYSLCSHQRSIELYLESLVDPIFYGVKCPSYRDYRTGFCSSNEKVNFAKPLKRKPSGTYFYVTNTNRPFLRKK